MNPPVLVPELMVTDLAASLAFWCGPCGFRLAFERPEEGFACIERDGSRLMLDALPQGRPHRWEVAPTTPPFGRHVNFEIAVDDLSPLVRGSSLDASSFHQLPALCQGEQDLP